MFGKYFYGHEISEYGQKNGFVDYFTLSQAFNHVLNNEIIANTCNIGNWDLISGCDYDEKNDEFIEIYQYYIVSDRGADILTEFNEIVYYNESLDMYVWGITHFGTSWDYVLTDIPCKAD